MSRQIPLRILIGWVLPMLLASAAAMEARADGLPPSWQYGKTIKKDSSPRQQRSKRRKSRPWYNPRLSFGVGLNVPEVLPFEGWMQFGKYFAMRGFLAPEVPTNIRVEMPTDVISTKKGIGVANPDYIIKLKSKYGPHYGLEFLTFPFGESFFIGAGLSYRRMQLTGKTRSNILVCSLAEAAKEPPCPDPDARIDTITDLTIDAKVETTAYLGRFAFGWMWHVDRYSYLTFSLGVTKPYGIKRKAEVKAGIDSKAENDDIEGALATIKDEQEADLERKAIAEMAPVDDKLLPILGLAVGFRL